MVVKRRKRKAQGGLNWRSLLGKAHSFAKDNKLVSRGLRALNYNKLASAADALGYGKPRRRRARRVRGNGFFDVLKGIGSVATNVASVIPHPYAQVGSAVGRSIGLGKRRRVRRAPSRRMGGNGIVNPYVMIY